MAYAAVITLKHTLQILNIPTIDPEITESAYKELNSLISMLKKLDDGSSRYIDRSLINELDAKIRKAVWKLEDVVESYSYAIDHHHPRNGVEQEIISFLKTTKNLREKYNRVLRNLLPREEKDAVPPLIHCSTTVGLPDLYEEIRNKILDGTPSKLDSVSLVGMAGIGKTHLATKIFHHPLTIQRFDSRVWVRVGPKPPELMNIFVDMIAQIERKPRYICKKNDDRYTLADRLGKTLRGRRYLVVFDDVWTKQICHCFNLFPDDKNGSRVLITTRLQEVNSLFSRSKIHQMPFLNNEESWNLLWRNVFPAEGFFPSQLEDAGRKIAKKCEGLPLLILAVAGILRGLDKTQEYWNKVAEKQTSSTFTDAYDEIYEVLLPSYEYLHQHLKPCFLYMGVFPQTCEIRLSQLIDLWTVEDFLEPSEDTKFEKYAMNCIEDLLSNSLAIEISRRGKSWKLHSAYWYLCVKEASKSKFFHVLNKLTDVSEDHMVSQRRLSVQNNILFGIEEVYVAMGAAAATSTTRSLLCTGEDHQYPVRICLNMMRLLKVLHALAIRFYEFPSEVLKLLQLRYLTLTHNGEIPCSISNLQQLQCLMLRRHHNVINLLQSSSLPKEIWDMRELRHLHIMGSNLTEPSTSGAMLPKLVTLEANAVNCSEDVFRSTPILKKLGIKIELQPAAAESSRCLEHIGVLYGLESVKCVVVNPQLVVNVPLTPYHHLSNLPWSLKKVTLSGLGYPWKYMSAIGSLPDLQVLKLRCYAFRGAVWEADYEQFKRLKVLLLEDVDLEQWRAPDVKTEGGELRGGPRTFTCFPRLCDLTVRHCYKLKMIPPQIGGIPFLERMEVDDCSPAVVASAHQIKEKSLYSHLQLVINSSWNLNL